MASIYHRHQSPNHHIVSLKEKVMLPKVLPNTKLRVPILFARPVSGGLLIMTSALAFFPSFFVSFQCKQRNLTCAHQTIRRNCALHTADWALKLRGQVVMSHRMMCVAGGFKDNTPKARWPTCYIFSICLTLTACHSKQQVTAHRTYRLCVTGAVQMLSMHSR